MYNIYPKNGVTVVPNVMETGDKAKVLYSGILYDSGASDVYMHFGYGDRWNESDYVKMQRTHDGFEATIPILKTDLLHLAFKDSANHWDNNTGRNYSFEVKESKSM